MKPGGSESSETWPCVVKTEDPNLNTDASLLVDFLSFNQAVFFQPGSLYPTPLESATTLRHLETFKFLCFCCRRFSLAWDSHETAQCDHIEMWGVFLHVIPLFCLNTLLLLFLLGLLEKWENVGAPETLEPSVVSQAFLGSDPQDSVADTPPGLVSQRWQTPKGRRFLV